MEIVSILLEDIFQVDVFGAEEVVIQELLQSRIRHGDIIQEGVVDRKAVVIILKLAFVLELLDEPCLLFLLLLLLRSQVLLDFLILFHIEVASAGLDVRFFLELVADLAKRRNYGKEINWEFNIGAGG